MVSRCPASWRRRRPSATRLADALAAPNAAQHVAIARPAQPRHYVRMSRESSAASPRRNRETGRRTERIGLRFEPSWRNFVAVRKGRTLAYEPSPQSWTP
jgi:hypothetical protein